ncbi:MAG: ArsR/SmtB family transcription factor [Candidatus Methylomirabilales bacterium]
MVNYQARPLDATFSALADPTRRAILARLARGASPVTRLAEPFDVSLPAISKHLRVLEDAGLLAREVEGRVHRCRLVARPLRNAAAFLSRYRRFWEAQLDALADYLRAPKAKEDPPWSVRRKPPRRRSASRGRSRRRASASSARGRSRRN